MADKTDRSVSRLLRVVVAGGVALAGVGGSRADDGTPNATQNADQAKDKEAKAKAERAETAAKPENSDEAKKDKSDRPSNKVDEQKKTAEPEGDGVKGW